MSALTPEQINEIRYKYDHLGMTMADLADAYHRNRKLSPITLIRRILASHPLRRTTESLLINRKDLQSVLKIEISYEIS